MEGDEAIETRTFLLETAHDVDQVEGARGGGEVEGVHRGEVRETEVGALGVAGENEKTDRAFDTEIAEKVVEEVGGWD
jgi:hypothetical protein